MIEKQVPARSWDYGVVYLSEILSIIARSPNGRPGMEEVKGETIDISEWLDFEFYDYVWYWDEKKMDMTQEQRLIGQRFGLLQARNSDRDKGRS
jgi:hypothetical protein